MCSPGFSLRTRIKPVPRSRAVSVVPVARPSTVQVKVPAAGSRQVIQVESIALESHRGRGPGRGGAYGGAIGRKVGRRGVLVARHHEIGLPAGIVGDGQVGQVAYARAHRRVQGVVTGARVAEPGFHPPCQLTGDVAVLSVAIANHQNRDRPRNKCGACVLGCGLANCVQKGE